MASPFYQEFDDILAAILTDYNNLDSAPNTGVGSIVWIKAACLASMLWGLYRYQDYLANQIFPDTADTDNLNHHGSVYGLPRKSGESDGDYAQRIVTYLAQPPAGGTLLDYKTWAEDTPETFGNVNENFLPAAVNTSTNVITVVADWVDGTKVNFTTTGGLPTGLTAGTDYYVLRQSATAIKVSTSLGGSAQALSSQGTGLHTILPNSANTKYTCETATCFGPPDVAAGTVSVIVTPNDETILGTGAMITLLNAVYAKIESLRPVTAALTSVLQPTELLEDVTMTVSPITADVTTIKDDISAYMDTLEPGATLYISKLEAIAINDGATNANVSIPATDIVPTRSQIIRPDNINIVPA